MTAGLSGGYTATREVHRQEFEGMAVRIVVPQDGLTREQLDVALLVAEAEAINSLPPYPAALPVSQSDTELGSFKLRRVECMSSIHAVARAELLDRLQLLEVSRAH